MSRQINEDEPLSDADRAFLLQNGQELRVKAHDERLGVQPGSAQFISGAEPALLTGYPATGLVNAPGVSPAQVAMGLGDVNMLLGSITTEALEAELERREAAAEEEAGEPADASVAATQVVREGETVEGTPVPSYDQWKADTLRAQLGVRELNKSGKKDELAQRLRDDDEDQA